MKIVIPTTREGKIDDHFGHCEHYTIFHVENKEILNKIVISSPEGCGCKSDIAPKLAKMGVTVMLAGNMGVGALQILNANGIKVFRGCSGNAENAIKTYLKGEILDSGINCHSHDGCNKD